MRIFDEIRITTNRKLHSRLRIHYDSPCGYCGVGRGCNRRKKHKYYHLQNHPKRQGVYPSWKLVSKNRKQWMKKPTWVEGKYQEIRW